MVSTGGSGRRETDAPSGDDGRPATDGPPSDAEWGRATRSREDRSLLAGPAGRVAELRRLLRIMGEFVRGFRALHFLGPAVTVFGSARFPEDHRYYAMAREVGRRLGRSGFTIMTGGGPGIMEAANRGARDVHAPSIGCNIQLPHEQRPNEYLDRFVEFRYFFVRKVMLVKYSYAFVVMPGGFGTLDEIFETATLVQTGKILDFPIVLMGSDYWAGLIDFVEETMIPQGTIDAADRERILVTDDPDEATSAILESGYERFGLVSRMRRRRALFEAGPPR